MLPSYKDFLRICDLDAKGVPNRPEKVSGNGKLPMDIGQWKKLCSAMRKQHPGFCWRFQTPVLHMNRTSCIEEVVFVQLMSEWYNGNLSIQFNLKANPNLAHGVAFFGIELVKVAKAKRADFDALTVPSNISAMQRYDQLVREGGSCVAVSDAGKIKSALYNIWRAAGFRIDVVDEGDLLLTFVPTMPKKHRK
jgi:hypothetical protein